MINWDKRRWLVLAICIVVNICAGFCYAWSVFQKPMAAFLQCSLADISLGFTLMMTFSTIIIVFAGKAQEYLAPRQVVLIGGLMLGMGSFLSGFTGQLWHFYLTYGTLCASGVGTVYAGTISNIVRFFPDRRGLAAGFASAGVSAGVIVWAPLATHLIENFGVLDAFKILGAIFVVAVGVGSRFIPTAPTGYQPSGWQAPKVSSGTLVADKNFSQMIKDPMFYCICLLVVLGTSSGLMIIGHASPILQETLGLSPAAAAFIVGFLGVANASGRAGWGSVSDKTGRFAVFIMLYLLAGSTMFLLCLFTNSYVVVVGAILTAGLCYGGFMGLLASLTADTFGLKHLGINFGIISLNVGVAGFIGPRLAAVIVSQSGSYTAAFAIAATLSASGVALTLLTMAYQRRRARRAAAA